MYLPCFPHFSSGTTKRVSDLCVAGLFPEHLLFRAHTIIVAILLLTMTERAHNVPATILADQSADTLLLVLIQDSCRFETMMFGQFEVALLYFCFFS